MQQKGLRVYDLGVASGLGLGLGVPQAVGAMMRVWFTWYVCLQWFVGAVPAVPAVPGSIRAGYRPPECSGLGLGL